MPGVAASFAPVNPGRVADKTGEPVRLTFRNERGRVIRGKSEPVPRHAIINLRVEAWDPCKYHRALNGKARRGLINGQPVSLCRKSARYAPRDPKNRHCTGPVLKGVREGPANLCTQAFALFTQNNMLATAESIKDTGNTSRSLSANSACSAPTIVAGTGTTAAAVTDVSLQTQQGGSSGSQAATINAYSGAGTSGSYTVTATITNTSGGTVAYAEVGLTIVSATFTFLIAHDVFSALSVSNNGTLAVTYTFTFS